MQLWRDRELRRFLKRGGKIWDTLYGEYLLTGQQVRIGRGAGLESVAKSYGGRTPKLDAVKEAWANGIQTYEIEPKVLIEYLHGDLDNTELIFKEHRKRALEQRQVVICQCRMDSLLCTTEMEYNGLKTDLDIAMKQAIELNLESAKLERETNSLIPTEIPRRLKKFWNWASNSHMAIYFFGGTLEIETQCYKSSSNLSKSGWARHTLSDNRDPTNLGPPNLISAPSECSFLSGGFSSEKSTKLSKSYLLHYFSEGGFRKSAPWPDSLAKTMLAKSRLDPSNVMEGPLINLLPTRYHVLMAAADIDDNTGKIKTLVFQNPISNEVFSFDLSLSRPDDDVTKEIEDFFLDQIRQHTRSVVDSNELMLYLRGAQLILVTRDAPFTWENAFQRDDRLRPIIERYGNNVESYHEFNPEDLCIVPVDCNVTLEFFRTKTSTDKLPSYLKNSHAKKKLSAAPFVTDLRLPAAEWCSVYAKLFREVSHITFADETLDVKKMTKKQKEARKVDEDNLPLLQRPVETLRRELPNLWTPDEVARFEMLFMLGKACATPFDPFYVVSFDKNVDVDIPGVLHSYIPEKGIAMAVMTNFRSHSTNALQVGTETLSYFAKTHKDPVAKSIINLRSMQKLIGTYYEFSEGSTGMVSLVHESDSCIHHELIHTKTNTGRLSAANPNCQNIPKEDNHLFVRYLIHGSQMVSV